MENSKMGSLRAARYFILTFIVLSAVPNIVIYFTAFMGLVPAVIISTLASAAAYYLWGRCVSYRSERGWGTLFLSAALPAAVKSAVMLCSVVLDIRLELDAVDGIICVTMLWDILLCTFISVWGVLAVYVLSLAAFVFGLRHADRLTGFKRKKLRAVPVAAFAACITVMLGLAGYVNRIRDLGRVDVRDDEGQYGEDVYYSPEPVQSVQATQGHGFYYENGYSSVDLSPYYVENPENILARLDEPSEFTVSKAEDMPVLNGAEAVYPVYSAFAACCYENIADIQTRAKETDMGVMPIRFTNTVVGFEELINGQTDIFFGSKPSDEQLALAEEKGAELVLTPIGREAFVFFVNSGNPVDGLTSEQIRKIYSGEYKSWSKVGGKMIPILAFQRPKNSGSQTRMERFMGDVPLKEPLEAEYEYSMVGVIKKVAAYQNKLSAIGYSFRYYAEKMFHDDRVKFLAVDGVYPDTETISDGSYPLTGTLYAVTVKGNDNDNEYIEPFLEWMTGEQGSELVERSGYVGIRGKM